MGKQSRKAQQKRRHPATPILKAVKWAALIVGIVLVIYAVLQTSGVAYDEDDMRVVDFSSLTPGARMSALRQANRARCTCGCGMNLAQCVATDMTCPIRDRNIETIKTMVRDARGT